MKYCSAKKREQTVDKNSSLDGCPETQVESDKSVPESCILCDAVNTAFLKLQPDSGEQLSVFARGQRREGDQGRWVWL